MKIQLRDHLVMKHRAQRNVLSQEVNLFRDDMCAPPSYKYLYQAIYQNERASLCAVKKGSLTIEAALVFPFFLMILLAFFSFFSQYASAAELQMQAAAEAKKVGIVLGSTGQSDSGDITIYKTAKVKKHWIHPFFAKSQIVQSAVCRGWIGFTSLDALETYVYVTPDGEVYHLFSDCTHLDLSIRLVSMVTAREKRNEYGQKYRECQLCDAAFGALVYITSEGDCYHSERGCSGLKRTIRQVPLEKVKDRGLCLRCMDREE